MGTRVAGVVTRSWVGLSQRVLRRRRSVQPAAAADDASDGGFFTLAFVRRRMQVLLAELEWLDREPLVFARGFRTVVAMSAYAALEADAQRLAAIPTLDLGCSFDLDLDDDPSPLRHREVVQV